jgi:hypothetical protein
LLKVGKPRLQLLAKKKGKKGEKTDMHIKHYAVKFMSQSKAADKWVLFSRIFLGVLVTLYAQKPCVQARSTISDRQIVFLSFVA